MFCVCVRAQVKGSNRRFLSEENRLNDKIQLIRIHASNLTINH